MKKIAIIFTFVISCICSLLGNNKIDRMSLVLRHNVVLTKPEALSPLSVGNGHFCSTVDLTGMQTFPEFYQQGIPLSIMSEWGWHSFPNVNNYKLFDTFDFLQASGKRVPYPTKNTSGYEFLRANPHQTGLALIGLEKIGGSISLDDLEETVQTLNLWEGSLDSRFKISGESVEVTTLCHPYIDRLAYKLKSNLFSSNKLGIRVRFPFPSAVHSKDPAILEKDDLHLSEMVRGGEQSWVIKHQVDDLVYYCHIQTSVKATLKEVSKHDFFIETLDEDEFTLLVDFQQEDPGVDSMDDFAATLNVNRTAWFNFWMDGGAVDLSGSKDPRWKELERRIVLSQYLTAIQSRQKYPPQETGLTCNSWYGKFHLEMHWWHSVHFTLWNRSTYLANTLDWYEDIFNVAKSYTTQQGYKGVRWPKMIGPNGVESPSKVGPLLVWQQPHLIFYCELLYRENQSLEFVNKYRNLIEATADFMFDYANWDTVKKCYVLGPPIISAREGNHFTYKSNMNPAFELAYWSWGLKKANDWRERLGLKRNANWDRMAEQMSPWPIVNNIYVEAESVLERDGGHPTQLAAYGFLPESPFLNKEVMRNTLIHVMNNWDWKDTWGWDYPLIAMTAVRLNEPELAIDALLMDVPKNTYLPNGHNYQTSELPLYLPGNGGLLSVVAMMCAGWDGCEIVNPGFPNNGKWSVKWEGLKPVF
ncbi:hypothetical protein H8784_01150 [Parabacteroides acidifaciens]|uniref:Glycoside hydrolase family 65 n=1 Tax=Parabacteroides acidifaciens TaxID=2290935 RepID=A0A3D8HIZ6_9BACT|nr:hypothetical protein [Parabacteroides acidifaciens]MBC8600323.1 hypothetical protein [Parabacteroides acidifaciens]RDU50955.1 hypothetical protein DWU89_01170 [Parabacteroides acidifaciens]